MHDREAIFLLPMLIKFEVMYVDTLESDVCGHTLESDVCGHTLESDVYGHTLERKHIIVKHVDLSLHKSQVQRFICEHIVLVECEFFSC